MVIYATVSVPETIYNIYEEAAKRLGNSNVEAVLSGALQAYAQYLFEEMRSSDEIICSD